ncbi:hypothetical protein [Nonomuraea sp. B19D2]|uniref:hypothetical protein n=1 Tax=Nonomuraea sp. B19D2 TaxID=3159561 RepID=UPI0032DB157B
MREPAPADVILTAREPFDFAASLAFLRRFPPTAGEQRLTADTLTKAFRVAGQTVLARVTATEAGLELTPDLDQFLAIPEERLTALVGNPRKGARLYAALRTWGEVSEPFLRDGPYEEVKSFLLGLPGIGQRARVARDGRALRTLAGLLGPLPPSCRPVWASTTWAAAGARADLNEAPVTGQLECPTEKGPTVSGEWFLELLAIP